MPRHVVIFGASGDLTRRKLVPALASLVVVVLPLHESRHRLGKRIRRAKIDLLLVEQDILATIRILIP